ncbi:methyltransferase [Streptomyces sp. Da 82-17]|uniref:methyltransferase n=1 Tax=Streptomyces sp. Da 82-17 TaxID=3377116 RepID=UPI0038D36890
MRWTDGADERFATWYAQNGTPPPRRVVPADSRMGVAAAYRHVCEGTALLWRGDYRSARQLLASLGRRAEGRRKPPAQPPSPAEAFHLQRREQARRARILGLLLIPYENPDGAGLRVALKGAPDVAAACAHAYGKPAEGPGVGSLRDLLGVVGAYEWHRKGVEIPALGPGARIHPRHGVFSPVRGEYVDLVAQAPLPPGADTAFDIGTGTGVLAVLLARRGVRRVTATDLDERAVACARDNAERFGLGDRIEVRRADLFPDGRADVLVCNPPWLPGRPRTALDRAVYDQDSAMLRGFLDGAGEHLRPGGEAWLIISDLAERLELRAPDELAELIAAAGLTVLGRLDTRPRHARARDENDPLYGARAGEVTSLWRLAPTGG